MKELTDGQIEAQIDSLETEREQLRERQGHEGSTPEIRARLDQLGVDLDQLWDLLRQRRALREAGRNPAEAHERAADVVERYWQ